MALDSAIISLIRDEVGDDQDFVDNISDMTATSIDSLEAIYTDTRRGNSSVLNVAAVVWRRRLANFQNHAFDAAQEGNWLARSQKARFLKYMSDKYDKLANQKVPHKNVKVESEAELEELDTDLD